MRTDMEFWKEVRRRVLTRELSKRAACREYELGWHTLAKILALDAPPGYRRQQPRAKPRLAKFLPVIHQMLVDDQQAPKKQRHTLDRIARPDRSRRTGCRPMTPKHRDLVPIDAAERAIIQPARMDEIKEIFDKAEPIRLYYKKTKDGIEIRNRAAEIKLQAERRAGVLVRKLDLARGKRSARASGSWPSPAKTVR